MENLTQEIMTKLEWGLKRTCQSCSAHFYDLWKNPIICPECGFVLEVAVAAKPRRGRPPRVEIEEIPDDAPIDVAADIIDEDLIEEGEDLEGGLEIPEKKSGHGD